MTASSMNSAYMRRFNPDSVSGLVIDLDARALTPGAVTSWTDRRSGYVLTGNATRDSQMNGYPSVTFNGSTDDLRTTGNAITQFNGIAAVTSIIIMKDTVSGTGQWWPYGYQSPPHSPRMCKHGRLFLVQVRSAINNAYSTRHMETWDQNQTTDSSHRAICHQESYQS